MTHKASRDGGERPQQTERGIAYPNVVIKRDNLRPAFIAADWHEYRKIATTRAVRMDGPFTVKTREGKVTCPDGYLAIDAHGWPYPIAKDEFDAIYEPLDPNPKP